MAQASQFRFLGQSQIGGLPIGVKLEGRLRIPSAILGGGGIEIRSRGPLATHREGELKRGSLEKRSLTRDRGFESFSLQRGVMSEPDSLGPAHARQGTDCGGNHRAGRGTDLHRAAAPGHPLVWPGHGQSHGHFRRLGAAHLAEAQTAAAPAPYRRALAGSEFCRQAERHRWALYRPARPCRGVVDRREEPDPSARPHSFSRARSVGISCARANASGILTAARTGEVIGATWAEFDLEHRLWSVPGER
jgi:hypothetical protein